MKHAWLIVPLIVFLFFFTQTASADDGACGPLPAFENVVEVVSTSPEHFFVEVGPAITAQGTSLRTSVSQSVVDEYFVEHPTVEFSESGRFEPNFRWKSVSVNRVLSAQGIESTLYHLHCVGGEWQVKRMIGGTQLDATVGYNDDVHAVFANDYSGIQQIYYTYWNLGSGEWSLPLNISMTPGISSDPAIMIDTDGTLVATWTDTSPGFDPFYLSQHIKLPLISS